MDRVSDEQLIQALRCVSSFKFGDEPCKECPYGIAEKWNAENVYSCDVDRVCMDAADRLEELAEAQKSERHGHWIYKHKVRGGIRYRTGEDSWGNVHTIQCDDRYPTDDPYCSECHKLNDGSSLDWCPNCGARMDRGEENET